MRPGLVGSLCLLEVVAGAGHNIQVEKPPAVIEAVEEVLARV